MKRIIFLLFIVCNCLVCNSQYITKAYLTANSWKVEKPDFHKLQPHILNFNQDNSKRLNRIQIYFYILHGHIKIISYLCEEYAQASNRNR